MEGACFGHEWGSFRRGREVPALTAGRQHLRFDRSADKSVSHSESPRGQLQNRDLSTLST